MGNGEPVTATNSKVGSKVLHCFNYTGKTEVLDGTVYSLSISVGTRSGSSQQSNKTNNFTFDE